MTIALGLINFSLLVNSLFGTLVSEEAPAAIDKAFRDLHAAAGHLLGSHRDDPVPDAVALRLARRHRRPTANDGQRRPPDRAAPDPVGGDPGRARRADHPAPLRARRVRRGEPRTSCAEALLGLGALAARSRGRACFLAHVLQPPAAVGHDRARGREPGRQRGRRAGPVRAARDRGRGARHGRRDDRAGGRPGRFPAPRPRRGRGRADRLARRSACCSPPRRWPASATSCGPRSTTRSAGAVGPDRIGGRRDRGRPAVYAAAVLALRVPEARQIARLLGGRSGRRS